MRKEACLNRVPLIERLETRTLLAAVTLPIDLSTPVESEEQVVAETSSATATTISPANNGTVVSIPDPILQTAIRAQLHKPTGDITDLDMLQLTSLDAPRVYGAPGITDARGLEYAQNLTDLRLPAQDLIDLTPLSALYKLSFLDLSLNHALTNVYPLADLTDLTRLILSQTALSDLTPLKGLANLQTLRLEGNGSLSDINALSGLTNLPYLDLSNDAITDLTPLVNLKKLTTLNLWGQFDDGSCPHNTTNGLNNIEPLKELVSLSALSLGCNAIDNIDSLSGLHSLTALSLQGNYLNNIAPLIALTNLTSLSLETNQISDISALAGLTNLTWLRLAGNQISDVTALQGLINLNTLSVGSNQLSVGSNNVEDISPLSDLINLTSLNLDHNRIKSIDALGHLTNLTSLSLDENQIIDIAPLVTLDKLASLHIAWNQIVDIRVLSGLKSLRAVSIYGNRIEDVTPLSSLENLYWLELDGNKIHDLTALAGLHNLTFLGLSGNHITEVVALNDLNALGTLRLADNQISDIGPLSALTNLTYLYLDRNQIQNLHPLGGLKQLQDLSLDSNGISDISPLTGLSSLKSLGLNWNVLTDVSTLGEMTALQYVYVRSNLLDLEPGSDTSKLITGLQQRGVSVDARFQAIPKLVIVGADGSSVSLPDAVVGRNRPSTFFAIRNDGQGELKINGLALVGINADEFQLQLSDERGNLILGTSFTILPGRECSVGITFDPTSPGTKSANISFTTNDLKNQSLAISLRGSAMGPPQLRVTDTSGSPVDRFAAVTPTPVGSASAPATFTVSNAGPSPLHITGFATTGADSSMFEVKVKNSNGQSVSGSAFVIAPDATYSLDVRLRPSAYGSRSAAINFTTDDPRNPAVTFQLSGAAIKAVPRLSIKLITLGGGRALTPDGQPIVSFGHVKRGTKSPVRSFQLTNQADGFINFPRMVLPKGYVLSFWQRAQIRPGETVLFRVRMSTRHSGSRSGFMRIFDTDSNDRAFSIHVLGSVLA